MNTRRPPLLCSDDAQHLTAALHSADAALAEIEYVLGAAMARRVAGLGEAQGPTEESAGEIPTP